MKTVWDEGVVGIKKSWGESEEKSTLPICIRERANKHNRKGGRLPRSVHMA